MLAVWLVGTEQLDTRAAARSVSSRWTPPPWVTARPGRGSASRLTTQAPSYPLVLMPDLFEIGPPSADASACPKTARIHGVRGWGPTASAARGVTGRIDAAGGRLQWQAVSMNAAAVGKKRSISPVQLLLAAGAALVVAFAGVRVYPFLASFEVAGVLLTAVRVVTYACLVAVFVLPIAAIVRRLIR